MRTPVFFLTQDDENVFIHIKVPYVRMSSAEICVDGREFTFYCSPFSLKLLLTGDVVSDSKCKCLYDPFEDNGMVHVTLPKQIRGEIFLDLDMISKLMLQETKLSDSIRVNQGSRLVQLIESVDLNSDVKSDATSDPLQEQTSKTEEDCDDSSYPVYSFTDVPILLTRSSDALKFGFNMHYSGKFEISDDIMDPAVFETVNRMRLRVMGENSRFDDSEITPSNLEAELDETYLNASHFNPYWCEAFRQLSLSPLQASLDQSKLISFSDTYKHKLYSTPGIQSNINQRKKSQLLLAIADILYSYCYVFRWNSGDIGLNDSCVHSLIRLSSTLSNFEYFQRIDDVILANYRKSLVFPYIRYFSFSKLIATDVIKLLAVNKSHVLKALFEFREVLGHSSSAHSLNHVFMDDIVVFLQSSVTENDLLDLSLQYKLAKKTLKEVTVLDSLRVGY